MEKVDTTARIFEGRVRNLAEEHLMLTTITDALLAPGDAYCCLWPSVPTHSEDKVDDALGYWFCINFNKQT